MAIPVLEPVPRRRRRASRSRATRSALGLTAVSVILVAAVVVAAFLLRERTYRDEALPGVRVLGVDVGGLERGEIAARVEAAGAARLARPIPIVAPGKTVSVRGDDVFRIDADATAAAALAARRESLGERAGALIVPFAAEREVQPVLVLRRLRLGQLVARLDDFGVPAVPAKVRLEGVYPLVTPSRDGRRVQQRLLFASLEQAVLSGGSVQAVYRRAAPPISNESAVEAADEARTMLSGPVALTYRGQALGTLEPERLARLLRFRADGGRYDVVLARRPLARAVRPVLEPWRRRATNARFAVSGELVSVEPSALGYDVDPVAIAAAVTEASRSPTDRTAVLTMRAIPAEITTQDLNALGIRRQLTTFTTDMGPSSSNRIHNVHLMADFVDGTVIRPGETFSFNGVVGPRTEARGFLEGQMIVGSLLLPAIGGGVCQTATTLFNNAFELGLPVVERHNHNLYISHYPLGRDATVSWGGPDLKFKNDLAHGILIKSNYTDSTLTFTFYGTPEGRRVVSETGPQVNFRTPTMTYALDPNAPEGSVRVVGGSNRSGFDVTVQRTVYEHGAVLRRDSFTSSYIPEGPTTIYGPGRTPPTPYIVIPTY